MRHPWCVPVLVVLAAFVGYAAASRPVQAQAEQWPFSIGEVITLTLPGGGTHRCTVEEIKGTFARCGTGERESFSIGQRERPEEWVNLAQVSGSPGRARASEGRAVYAALITIPCALSCASTRQLVGVTEGAEELWGSYLLRSGRSSPISAADCSYPRPFLLEDGSIGSRGLRNRIHR